MWTKKPYQKPYFMFKALISLKFTPLTTSTGFSPHYSVIKPSKVLRLFHVKKESNNQNFTLTQRVSGHVKNNLKLCGFELQSAVHVWYTMHSFSRFCHSSTSTALASFYDIIIVGGGMVGNAMACAIGLNENLRLKRVLVLDSAEIKPPTKNSPYGNRVSAVSPPAVLLFKNLGIWNDLVDLRVKRVDRLQV
ncbi:unnamed protein product [Thelazia callipaeda]|uniref:Ubiquinone biosynthesis monooxygenase COQ6, mitochondrial n=1 Tax=Thelazia callipaeda TaxID=103827 RepID=A0A0N5D8V9_THECL|nr:unnamed protein product [Thelazia callipaeda]